MRYFVLLIFVTCLSMFISNCSVNDPTSADSLSDSLSLNTSGSVVETLLVHDTINNTDTITQNVESIEFDSSKSKIDSSFLRKDTSWSNSGITFYYDQYILDGPYVRRYIKSKKSTYIDGGEGEFFSDTLIYGNTLISNITKSNVEHSIFNTREYKTVTGVAVVVDTNGTKKIFKVFTDTSWTFSTDFYRFPHKCLNDVFSINEGYHLWMIDTISGYHAYLVNSNSDLNPNDTSFEFIPNSVVYDTTKFYAKSNKGYFCLSYGFVRDTLKIHNKLNYILVSKDNLGLIGHWEGEYSYANDYLTDLDVAGESGKIDQNMSKKIEISINEKDSGTVEMYFNGWRVPHNIVLNKNDGIIYSTNTGEALFKYKLIENRLLEIEEIVEYGKSAFDEFSRN